MSNQNQNANAGGRSLYPIFHVGYVIQSPDPVWSPFGPLHVIAVDIQTQRYVTETLDMVGLLGQKGYRVSVPFFEAHNLFQLQATGLVTKPSQSAIINEIQGYGSTPVETAENDVPLPTGLMNEPPVVRMGFCPHCGTEKVWYTPFRGERERVCPTCPTHG